MMVGWGRCCNQSPLCTDQRSGSAVVFSTGLFAFSGAVVGYVLAGNGSASIGLLAFPLLAGWCGWQVTGGLMTEKTPPLGSYGLRSTQDSFSRHTSAPSASGGRPTVVFGKRTQPVYPNLSLQHVRLSHLLSELKALFNDNAIHGEAPEFVLVGKTEELRLLISGSAAVMIDGESGYFVFREKAVDAGLIVVTSSDERLIDHVVCHLAAEPGTAGSETYNIAARMLVGETLADVERRMILQTLRHCHGNRTRTVEMLGVSLRTIRNKLRSYWLTTRSEEARR